MTVRVAISGLGSIGQQHGRAFAARDDVAVVTFDPDSNRRAEAAAQGWEVTDSFEALLATDAAALVVATPDFAHIQQAAAGIRAGKAVLIEKPVSDRLSTAIEARDVLAAGRSIVGYVLRHRRVTQRVKELLDEGAIGDPVSFQVMLGAYGTLVVAKSRFATPEKNRLYRDYSHEWDYLRWFFGPVAEVIATARVVEGLPHVEQPNSVDALILMASGVAGAVHIDYVGDNRTITILGEGGAIFADLSRGTVVLRQNGTDGIRRFDYADVPGDALRRQAAHLLDVAAGKQPIVTFEDGLAALGVSEALIASAETRTAVGVARL